jgi:hypothetical protein
MEKLDDLGDEASWPAEDLEKLYRLGGDNPIARIRGSVLNNLRHVKSYDPNAWYVVTDHGVEKLG